MYVKNGLIFSYLTNEIDRQELHKTSQKNSLTDGNKTM